MAACSITLNLIMTDLVHQDDCDVGLVGADSRPGDGLRAAVRPPLRRAGYRYAVCLSGGEKREQGCCEGEEMHLSDEVKKRKVDAKKRVEGRPG